MLLNWVFKWKMSFENWCFFLLTLFSIFPKNFLMTRSWCFFLAEKHWQLIYYHQKMIIFFTFLVDENYSILVRLIDWLTTLFSHSFCLRKNFFLDKNWMKRMPAENVWPEKARDFFVLGFKMSNDVFHHQHRKHPIRL